MATIVPDQSNGDNKPSPEGYVVIEKTSKHGNKYQVGVPEEAAELQSQKPEPKPQAPAAPGEIRAMDLHTGAPQFPINPPWEVGKNWQDTTDEVMRNTGITRYKIDDGGWLFTYRLWVHTERTAFYNFHDGSPDNYLLATIIHHDHYMDYNSSDARMFSVEVSDVPRIPT